MASGGMEAALALGTRPGIYLRRGLHVGVWNIKLLGDHRLDCLFGELKKLMGDVALLTVTRRHGGSEVNRSLKHCDTERRIKSSGPCPRSMGLQTQREKHLHKLAHGCGEDNEITGIRIPKQHHLQQM
ncbi:hypothetical protein E2C01_057225 [Portunus trituberculatus]|uniref:Uncharacterized protein n=1 Tax=Portunus trituberculatus TaxID=210409 RepID=A0A5B7GW82_PORTR|nr:hypothetical protein [Portunus trituberculatus]